MSQTPAGNQPYSALPLTNDDHIGDALYNAPRDNGPPSPGFNTPLVGNNPLPDDDNIPPGAARPRFLGHAAYADEIRASYASSHNSYPSMDRNSEFNSSVYALNDGPAAPPLSQYGQYQDDPSRGINMSPMGKSRFMDEKRAVYAPPRKRRKVIIWAIIISAILLIAAVLIPLYFAVIKPRSEEADSSSSSDNSSSGKNGGKDSTTGKPVSRIVTGGDGSSVTMDDGTKFKYENKFGGYWYWDEEDPFNNGARAQSWSPALNETFKYGIDKVRGVNIGGWLTLEPFIVPGMFEPHLTKTPPAIDEWTLHGYISADELEDHYKTFITEKDFAEIAAAGLNYIRVPIPFWAIEVREGEPFHGKLAWTYFLKAIGWARKYGLRINLDLHAVPGSQNGWNHSGKFGTVNFLNGPMGIVNAQRTLDYIRILAQFISQPQYRDVITMFGILNEPQAFAVGKPAMESFYLEAYKIIREVGGIGEGNGPWISIHDAFEPRSAWANFLPNADRITIDSHPYICFNGQSDAAMSTYATTPCANWGKVVNDSMGAFGMTNAGEWSNAVTDCGLWVTGVNQGTRYEGDYVQESHPRTGSCDQWTNYQTWTPAFKNDVKNFAMASMDALQNYFFWTWKIGPSIRSKKVESPQWSYSLGLEQGWMPKDPREALGYCQNSNPWSPPLPAAHTGGVGAGNIPPSATSGMDWPPTISNGGAPALLPSLTPTGVVPTLPAPTFAFTSATATPTAGNGWANPADTAGLMVPIATCSYLDAWIGPTALPPSPLCS